MNNLNVQNIDDCKINKHYDIVSLSTAPDNSDIPEEGYMYVWKEFENDIFKIHMKDSTGRIHSICEEVKIENNDYEIYSEDDFISIDNKMYLTINSLKPVANTFIESLSGANIYDLNTDFDISLNLNLNETTIKFNDIQLNGKKVLVQFASNKNIIENGNLYVTENVNVDESEFMKKVVSTIILLEN